MNKMKVSIKGEILREILELKITITEMKNLLEELKGRFVKIEERIGITMEIIKSRSRMKKD